MNKTTENPVKIAEAAIEAARQNEQSSAAALRAADNKMVLFDQGRAGTNAGPEREAWEAERALILRALEAAHASHQEAVLAVLGAEAGLVAAENEAARMAKAAYAPKPPSEAENQNDFEVAHALKDEAAARLQAVKAELAGYEMEMRGIDAEKDSILRDRGSVDKLAASLSVLEAKREILSGRIGNLEAERETAVVEYASAVRQVLGFTNARRAEIDGRIASALSAHRSAFETRPLLKIRTAIAGAREEIDGNPVTEAYALAGEKFIRIVDTVEGMLDEHVSEIEALAALVQKKVKALELAAQKALQSQTV